MGQGHSRLKVLPALIGDPDVGRRDLIVVLLQKVQEEEEVPRSAVENSEEVVSEVASKLSKLTLNLACPGKGERGIVFETVVETVELQPDRRLPLNWTDGAYGHLDRLNCSPIAVVHRPHLGSLGRLLSHQCRALSDLAWAARSTERH